MKGVDVDMLLTHWRFAVVVVGVSVAVPPAGLSAPGVGEELLERAAVRPSMIVGDDGIDRIGGAMKGIIFNLLEELIRQHHGEDTWDALLEAAGVGGAYTSLGSYDDAEMTRLVTALSTLLGQPPEVVLRWFGRQAMPSLAQKFPTFFSGQASTRPFLLTLNEIIHPEVRKLYPGADVPVFDFDDSAPNVLVMGYSSARRLCALAEGFVEGAAEHFGETVVFEHDKCMHRGDDKCVFRLTFSPRAQ